MVEDPKSPNRSMEQFFTLGTGRFIPHEVRFRAGNFPLQGDNLDPWLEMTATKLNQFIKDTPRYLQDFLFYTPFCKKYGLMKETVVNTPIGEVKVAKPKIPLSEQTSEELVGDIRWQEFMHSYAPPREDKVKAVHNVIGGLWHLRRDPPDFYQLVSQ